MEPEDPVQTTQERCEECGAKLTEREIQMGLEYGTPSLCSVHAAESTPLEGDEPADAGL